MDKDFKTIGYFPCWKVKKEKKVRYDVFTHINYSFAFPDGDDFQIVLPNAGDAENLIQKAHATNVKVLLSIGGWDDFGTSYKEVMLKAIETTESTNKFVEEIAIAINELDFDGADICFSGLNKDDNTDNLIAFITKLNKELKKNEKLLTITSFGEKDRDTLKCFETIYVQDNILQNIDWINIIYYELRTGVRSSNIKLQLKYNEEDLAIINASNVCVGIPFFVNVSLMAYEEDLKDTLGELTNSKDIVSCGRELYYSADENFEHEVEWAYKNANGINIWEITQDFSNDDESYITKIKNIVSK